MSKRLLLKNISFLYVLQIANYLAPLLTTPYLARVLGVAEFGQLGVAAAFVGYFVMIGEWSFNYTAVAQVARNADDPAALRRLVWDVMLAKAALATASIVAITVITVLAAPLRAIWPTIAATAVLLLVNVISLHWLLQGLEKLGAPAIGGLVARLLTLPLIFLLVKSPADTWIAGLVLSGTLLVSTGVSIVVAARYLPSDVGTLSFRGAFEQIREGWRLFMSNGAISLYTYTSMLAVGIVAGPVQAGYLSGAERIRRAAQNATMPIVSAVYPRINNMIVSSPERVLAAFRNTLLLQGVVTLTLSMLMFLLAPWGTVLFLGEAFKSAVPVVQVLALTPFLSGMVAALGTNIMLPLGMNRAFSTIVLVAGFASLLVIVPLALWLGALGGAIAYALAEFLNAVLMAAWLYSRRHEIARRFATNRPEPVVSPNAFTAQN